MITETAAQRRFVAAELELADARAARDAEIAARYADGESAAALGRAYGMTRANVHNIRRAVGVPPRPRVGKVAQGELGVAMTGPTPPAGHSDLPAAQRYANQAADIMSELHDTDAPRAGYIVRRVIEMARAADSALSLLLGADRQEFVIDCYGGTRYGAARRALTLALDETATAAGGPNGVIGNVQRAAVVIAADVVCRAAAFACELAADE